MRWVRRGGERRRLIILVDPLGLTQESKREKLEPEEINEKRGGEKG